MNAGLNEDVEISIDFDDSIIEDKSTDFTRDMQLLSGRHYERLGVPCMKWLNEDDETAKKMLPKAQDMTDEGEDEIE